MSFTGLQNQSTRVTLLSFPDTHRNPNTFVTKEEHSNGSICLVSVHTFVMDNYCVMERNSGISFTWVRCSSRHVPHAFEVGAKAKIRIIVHNLLSYVVAFRHSRCHFWELRRKISQWATQDENVCRPLKWLECLFWASAPSASFAEEWTKDPLVLYSFNEIKLCTWALSGGIVMSSLHVLQFTFFKRERAR